MNYRRLGRTGLEVSPICLGCMTFGREIDEAAAVAIIDHALEAGINFLDTANVYAKGRSEEIVGRALRHRRDQVVIASKFGNPTGDGPNRSGGSRAAVMAAVDGSLQRLQTDHIDLYQMHRFDPHTPLEETLGALDDIVRVGKVRYIGCSNFAAWQVTKALGISERAGWQKFASVQPRYNVVFRSTESEVLPMCESEGLGVLCFSPLGGGFLTGKYRRGEPTPQNTRMQFNAGYREIYINDRNFRVVEAMASYAQRHGIPQEQLAIAWVMSHPQVTAPIIGARTIDHLETALAALALGMTAEQRGEITRLADAAEEG